jgi:hypothetical protein
LNDTGILWVIYWMQFYPRVGQSGVQINNMTS